MRDGIAKLIAYDRRAPVAIDEARALELLDRLVARYQLEVQELAPLVNALARAVPRRRLRKLHVGLFGYNRASADWLLRRTTGAALRGLLVGNLAVQVLSFIVNGGELLAGHLPIQAASASVLHIVLSVMFLLALRAEARSR